MIDYRQISFSVDEVAGVTLIHHEYIGFGLIGRSGEALAITPLMGTHAFSVHHFDPTQDTSNFFFVPNCGLRFDPKDTFSKAKDPPLGSLLLASGGISVMVQHPRFFPAPLAIVGEPPSHSSQATVVTAWSIVSPDATDAEEVFSFDVATESPK